MGRYGAKVRIFEPRLGAPLRWDYREGEKRTRPEVVPLILVRPTPDSPVDVLLERKAIDLCNQKAASLTLEPLRKDTEPESLTVGGAYALYFDPINKALPKSKEARNHHTASRTFWETHLKPETKWDAIAPATVKAGITGLIEAGRLPTAEKRLANLRTLYHWLRTGMAMDQLRDPSRTCDKKKLFSGHQPRRPRYTKDEVEKILEKAHLGGPRFDLFAKLMADSGARAVQVRVSVRSGLNCDLEPPPPAGVFPCGWIRLPKVKDQPPMLTALTQRQRKALDTALEGYLSESEKEWLEHGTDYYLIPGGPMKRLEAKPITDNALRKMWFNLEEKAGLSRVSRRGFHGSRRAWSDDIFEAEGLDTLAAAGGWTKTETPESIYVNKQKYTHIEKARKHREKDGE